MRDDRHRPLPDPARFWSRVDKSSPGCWPWIGHRDTRKGYGRFHHSARSSERFAHRIAWLLTKGPIPEDMSVLHSCDNPPCVNPAHLYLGTNADNVADRQSRRRQAKGERHGVARLTEADVRLIRIRHQRGHSKQALAAALGVAPITVRRVLTGETWSHVR